MYNIIVVLKTYNWLIGGNILWMLANALSPLTGFGRNLLSTAPVKNNLISGELAERSKAAVLKTVEVRASWGSNP